MYGAAITLREEVFKNSQIRWHLDWGWYIGTMAEEATAAEIKKKKNYQINIVLCENKINFKSKWVQGTSWQFNGWDSELPLQGAQVQSLAMEPRSCKLCSVAKKNTKTQHI